jgi:predicted nucleic acid-binding Zn ribbon protein
MDTQDPIPLRNLLVPGILPGKVVILARVRSALRQWKECVEPEFAHRAVPERYRDKVLYVRVEGSVWLQELHMRKRFILAKLNALAGADLFEDIRFYVGGKEDT